MEKISKELQFFIFLLEHYAAVKKQSAADVLREWDALDLTDFIFGMYDRYHCEALENAYADIDALTEEKKQDRNKGNPKNAI